MPSLRPFIYLSAIVLLAGCVAPARSVRRLIPVPTNDDGPVICRVSLVAEGTPADVAGVRVGDAIQQIDGRRFTQAAEFLSALNDAPDSLRLGVQRGGRDLEIQVKLAPKPPRLGVRCDIADVQAVVEDVEQMDRYAVLENRKGIAISAEAVDDGGLVRVTLGVENFREAEVSVDPARIRAIDGTGVPLSRMAPADALRHLKGNPAAMVRASQTDEFNVQTISPRGAAAGDLYFAGPAAYPFRLFVEAGGETFEFRFENKSISSR